ncbi:hypothetical protein [Paenibacillus xylanexedens]|uniref:hypothetical protein n=1 Tax=Paenibacillus xylanexedens TaxID=528191 RepID=UPI0011A4DA6F|nr:hypothetical protein [Paenibacillus xylanexedens]
MIEYVILSMMFAGFMLIYGLIAHQAVEPLEHVAKSAAVFLIWPIMAVLYIAQELIDFFKGEDEPDE